MELTSARAPKRVMIVEDSLVVREFLIALIDRDPRLRVVATVASGEEALRRLQSVRPDVITMDIRLPGMSGLEATQRIMSECPTPIVVVAASVASEDLNISMNALRAGALSVIEKPVGLRHTSYEEVAERLCTQLVLMSEVRVIRQKLNQRPPVSPPASAALPPLPQQAASGSFSVLGIVASTGGPNALVKVLNGLPADYPIPILVVQHITPAFLGGFVSWLDDVCPQHVVQAEASHRVEPGQVYVAPPDFHLQITRDHILQLVATAPVSVQRPSGTVLFSSMASTLGSECIGVLLTGMGEDGARGLLELRDAGGYTIAEAESTAVVYGMPAAAVRLGAVCESLPVDEISARLLTLTSDHPSNGK